MKKIFLGLLIAIALHSVCFGADNDEIYVRRDVFDAKMEAFFERIDKRFEQLDKKIDTAISEIKGEVKALSVRMDGLEKRMDNLDKSFDNRVDSVNKQINSMSKFILIILGALTIGQYINVCFELRRERKERENNAKYLTLDDVRRIIAEDVPRLVVEEINVRFSEKSQVS